MIYKKIFLFIVLVLFVFIPNESDAQSTSGTCTGEIRTNLAAAEDCVNKAIAQGQALGYDMSCRVEQLPLGGFVDPTSGKDYILNGVCTVNDSTGHGAYLLAGFTAAPGSNAIIQSINPGWSILQTELAYGKAFAQCGGKAPYGSVVNGVSVYSCTAPPGALPLPAPTGANSTKTSTSNITSSQRYVSSLMSILNAMIIQSQAMLDNTRRPVSQTSTTNNTGAGNTNTGSSCYLFTKNLKLGDSGPDVLALTYVLNKEGFLSEGKSSLFTSKVMGAVQLFQKAHATEILHIINLTQGTGIVGEKTRAYLNSNCSAPATISNNAGLTSGGATCATTVRSDIKNGKYRYTFTKNSNNTWNITLNNPAYSTPSDKYYVQPNFVFIAPTAADLNRQNQGRFNYLSTLPGTAAGNTEYANLYGSFINAFYDWDNMTKDVEGCVTH